VVGAAGAAFARALELQGLVSYWGSLAPAMVVLTLLAAILWMTRLRPLVAAAVAFLAFVWLAAAFTPLTRLMAEGLVRRDPVASADAVFVLYSRLQRDGEPTPAALSRLVHALELLGEGRSTRLVLSELRPPAPRYATVARALLDHLGIAAELLVVGPVYSTRDEATALGALFKERGWKTALAVTSPTHSARACAALEREGIVTLCSPAVETRFDLETLEESDDRVTAFGSLVHERVGLWLYRARGWIR
jgi:uncharacterized SAM-binding protein YcdF (DUF218 family)